MDQPTLSRKDVLSTAALAALALALPKSALSQTPPATPQITIEDLKTAQKLAGLNFSDDELKEALPDVKDWLAGYEGVRKQPITYQVEPPTVFQPFSLREEKRKRGIGTTTYLNRSLRRPISDEDLAYLPVRDLAQLIRSKQISSVELTDFYLARLERYGDKLLAVVTLMPEQARADAKKADQEMAAGRNKGLLHGIPTGVKDLFALKGFPTTWGAEPYKDQVFDYDAAVVENLRGAGAIICAKTSLGALAQGDVWFKGKTKNPWNPAEGSSGSSAGSAACVSAGLLPYAIGTETLGSIMSPSNQCRVTGLRPSYGRISRYGAMAVSWTMDKIGPICRCAEDAAIVFAHLAQMDTRDRSWVDRPFHFKPDVDVRKLRIAFLLDAKEDAKTTTKPEEMEVLQVLARLGAKLQPVSITPAEDGLFAVLEVEAAAAFDELTRSDRIHLLKDSSWPQSYRASRFVPGVEFLQAQRGRTLLMQKFEEELGDVDVLVADGRGGSALFITNLTGHPQMLLPWGADEKGKSKSVSLIGRLYEEDTLLAVANAIQLVTNYHSRRPDLSKL